MIDSADGLDVYAPRFHFSSGSGSLGTASNLLEIRSDWEAVKLSPPAPDGSFIELDENFDPDAAEQAEKKEPGKGE